MDFSELKKEGFIPQRQTGYFSLRLKVIGGRLEAENLRTLAELAQTHGRGHVHLTSRQSVEIPFIRMEEIPAVKGKLAEAELAPAGLGPGLRTMTACQGAAVCPSGLGLTQDLVETLERELDGSSLPHKFKIGLTGCHNNCLKAEENDIGLKGALIPMWSRPDLCVFCGLCQKACPVEAISVNKDDRYLSLDSEKCVHCGRCFNKCPNKCWNGRPGWHLYFGGLFGNEIQIGRHLLGILTEDPEILAALNLALDFYRQHGRTKERFGRTINRLGWDSFADFMTSRSINQP